MLPLEAVSEKMFCKGCCKMIVHDFAALLPVTNIFVSESLGMVLIHWTEPANNADSVTYYRIQIGNTYYYTNSSSTHFAALVSTFIVCESYSISVVPCALLPGCMENGRSEVSNYVFAQQSKSYVKLFTMFRI